MMRVLPVVLLLLAGGCYSIDDPDSVSSPGPQDPTSSSSAAATVTNPGAPPNVLVILDTSGSMADWPQPWPTTSGCSHASITSLGYNPATVYPPMWANLNVPNTAWFDNAKFYTAPVNGYGTNFTGSPSATIYTSPTSACTGAPNVPTCQTCLATQGYYVGNSTYRRVSGNFLNFYGPRDAGAVSALSQMAHDFRNARFGAHIFSLTTSTGCGFGQCLCNMEPMGPTCSNSFPLNEAAVDSQRNNILANLRTRLRWGGCSTPLSNTLFLAGASLVSQSPLGVPFTWDPIIPPAFEEGPNIDQHSICFDCGFTAVVLLTDGEPSGDEAFFAIPPEIASLTVPPCPAPCTVSKLPKVAKWFWKNDTRQDQPGLQRIATYTIGFSADVANSNLLRQTAEQGGGQFFGAISSSQLRQALQSIADDIVIRNESCDSNDDANDVGFP